MYKCLVNDNEHMTINYITLYNSTQCRAVVYFSLCKGYYDITPEISCTVIPHIM